MVIPARFERATPRLGIWCSILLSYGTTTNLQSFYTILPLVLLFIFHTHYHQYSNVAEVLVMGTFAFPGNILNSNFRGRK